MVVKGYVRFIFYFGTREGVYYVGVSQIWVNGGWCMEAWPTPCYVTPALRCTSDNFYYVNLLMPVTIVSSQDSPYSQ